MSTFRDSCSSNSSSNSSSCSGSSSSSSGCCSRYVAVVVAVVSSRPGDLWPRKYVKWQAVACYTSDIGGGGGGTPQVNPPEGILYAARDRYAYSVPGTALVVNFAGCPPDLAGF
ncbi:hypothetical protein QTP88_006190 [Uroleucon formosanum]